MVWELKLGQKGLLLIAIPLAFEFGIFAKLVSMLGEEANETAKERHSRSIVEESNTLLRNFIDCGLDLMMYKSTKDMKYIRAYEQLIRDIPKQISYLESLLKDSPNQQEALKRIETLSDQGYELLGRAHRLVNENGSTEELQVARKAIGDNTEQIVNELRHLIAEQERTQISGLDAPSDVRLGILKLLWCALGCSFVLAGGLALYFNSSTTRRVAVLIDNTRKLSRHEQLHPIVSGSDEIAHLDQVFHQMEGELKEANRRKQELVAMVSHDLRTPLTSIQAALTLLSAGLFGELNEAGGRQITAAERSATRLINLINDLLDIEKMESGKLEYTFADCSVDAIVQASIDSVMAFADDQSIAVDYQDQSLMVYADAERIIQVLTNFLSNAIKFSPPQSTVSITSSVANQFVRISVKDQGRGIPESHLEKVFDRFEQVDPNDPTERKGSGLGLPICKAIINGHGGMIGVQSEYGKGSNFWIRLPIAKSKETSAERP